MFFRKAAARSQNHDLQAAPKRSVTKSTRAPQTRPFLSQVRSTIPVKAYGQLPKNSRFPVQLIGHLWRGCPALFRSGPRSDDQTQRYGSGETANYARSMAAPSESLNQLVTGLVPLLSRSLAEQFNVFRVMHHGTHEKQLSNVFAWLLNVEGTHGLGDAFQRIFLEQVNVDLPKENQLPVFGYRVAQEVDTSGYGTSAADIADIVLTGPNATVVIENYEYSDGHGHDYRQYLEYGAAEGQPSVVVLLCVRHERQLQTHGWEQAVVVTYAEVLDRLRTHIANDKAWRQNHQQQHFFLNQLFEHYLEGPRSMSTADQLAREVALDGTVDAPRARDHRFAVRPNCCLGEQSRAPSAGEP